MSRASIKILRDDSGFSDLSIDLNNFLIDSYSETSPTAIYYFGYHKPLAELFFELKTPFTAAEEVSFEYFNGAAFTALEVEDYTKNLNRSGFIKWNREQSNESKTTVDGSELYWYKMSFVNLTTTCEFMGINLVFTNDDVIREHEPQLIDDSGRYYPAGYSSFIPFRVAARNEIIQRLRNEGRAIKIGGATYDLTIFDLMQIEQLREAAKMKLISMVYFNRSDTNDDKYYQKANDYIELYNDAYRTFFLSIDKNDNGKEEAIEQGSIQIGTVRRA